jgi:hypothetical protein
MRKLAAGPELVDILTTGAIRDSTLRRICIYQEERVLKLEIELKPCETTGFGPVLLRFEDIKEYLYSFEASRGFYDITNCKFFVSGDGFVYLSIDPYGEEEMVSEKDNDFVQARAVVGFLLDES